MREGRDEKGRGRRNNEKVNEKQNAEKKNRTEETLKLIDR